MDTVTKQLPIVIRTPSMGGVCVMDTVTKQLAIVVKTPSMGERLCCGHCDKTATNSDKDA